MISPKNKFINLLAGASVVALSAASVAHAETLSGVSETVTIVDDADFIYVDETFDSGLSGGDIVNEAIIGGSVPVNIGFEVNSLAIIGGSIINTTAGEILAASVSTPTASAVGLYLGGAVVSGISNDGVIDALASANGLDASAYAAGVVYGQSSTGMSLADLLNGGTIVGNAVASASDLASALASAYATGVLQIADTGGLADVWLENTGDISAVARGEAYASNPVATASAYAAGVYQSASGDGAAGSVASATTHNSGTITADARAFADATTGAYARAGAYGLSQYVSNAESATIDLINDGAISARASAVALGSGIATADAVGVDMYASSSVDVYAENNALISAHASASANGDAYALARGINLLTPSVVSGSFTNSGQIEVFAAAATESGSSVSGVAKATGILVDSGEFNGTITNTGSIVAKANGASGWATGIRVAGGGAGTGIGVIENDGGTIEAIFDDGVSQDRATAIDVQNASNAIDIHLKGSVGDATILGDIEVSADDTITVTDGNTYLTGNINPDGTPEGDLTVEDGGALWLRNGGSASGGESVVTVMNYTQSSGGTVAIGIDEDGTYSQIKSDTVALGGSMVVDLNAGLYADSATYYGVVSAGIVDPTNVIDTTWDDVSTLTPLMVAEVIYNGGTADLTLTRVAFNDVAGLTRNQGRVASGIENAYMDPENSAAFDDLTGQLFTLDAAGYPAALDDLSGVEHAVAGQQVMRSFRNMDAALAGVQGRDCESGSGSYATSQVQGANVITPVADLDLVDCSGGSLWVGGQGLWANASNTSESPGFDETEWSIYGGVDYTLSTGTTLGMMVGYVNADIDFDGGSDASFDGYQVGVYGQQNWEAFYLQGLVAYGNMDVDVHRDIVVGDIAGTSRSNYDDAVWYINGEMGYSWGLGLDWDATPYAGLAYANLDGDGFNESGLDGADLSGSVDGESLVSALGVRLSADWGNTTNYWRPELSLAWEHEFGDFTTLDAAFIGAPASGFSVTGGDYGRDAAVVEAGFAYGFEGMEFKLNYAGRWTADYDDQAVYGQFTAKF